MLVALRSALLDTHKSAATKTSHKVWVRGLMVQYDDMMDEQPKENEES